MAKDFFRTFIEDLDDPDTHIAADGKSSAEFASFIDTGSYILNAAFSGTLFGGFPDNKAIILAGDPAVGKTFFALSLVKRFLDNNPKARVFYYDTEGAVTNQMMVERGIDIHRVVKSEPATLEDFRNKCIKLLDKYEALGPKDRFPAMLVLDSLSQLPSHKEGEDARAGTTVKDMTKAPVIKGIFRILRLKMAKLQIPMVVTNHTYAVVGAYVPTKEVAGGNGAKYASDIIAMLSKAKDKDDASDAKRVTGSIITALMAKSRMTREQTKVHTRIAFDGGLDRYYGLLEYAVAWDVVEKVGNKYKFPNGDTAFEKAIKKNPEKFWTDEVLKALDVHVGKNFKYSSAPTDPDVEEADDVEDADA